MQIRQARPQDANEILAIKQAAIGSIEPEDYTPEQLAAWQPDDDALEDFERAIESDLFVTLLAEIDGQSAAYGVLNTTERRIDAVFVHPDFMGQGLGRAMVRQFETSAQMVGLPDLKIVSSLNAKAFYESLDYWDFGNKTRTINGKDLEFAIMRKTFTFEGDK